MIDEKLKYLPDKRENSEIIEQNVLQFKIFAWLRVTRSGNSECKWGLPIWEPEIVLKNVA